MPTLFIVLFAIAIAFSIFLLYNIATNQLISISQSLFSSLIVYLFLLHFIVCVAGISRKYDKIRYVSIFVPIALILTMSVKIYHTRQFVEDDIISITMAYVVLTILTHSYLKEISSITIGSIVGKDIHALADDFFVINTITQNYFSSIQRSRLLRTIIENVCGYNLISIESLYIDNKKCKIYDYSKKAEWNGWYTENVLLLELPIITSECIEDIGECESIRDFEIFNESEFTDVD